MIKPSPEKTQPFHVHILGICGTFMGSLAQIAVELGFRVTGCDKAVYPPMSIQLEQAGIELIDGFDPSQLDLAPDLVIVGNVVSRGNPLMEAVLDRNIPYISGPQWLSEYVLQSRWVLAVAGTHGKTTTSSMLAWVLEYAGMQPGYLIGGVPGNFECSARLGSSDFFVIEADEYDTAFFDKRSKFVHYRPRTVVLNNLEYDHADIFPDLAAIQTQFHHLMRMVPSIGRVIYPSNEQAIDQVVEKGCWSEVSCFSQNDQTHSGASVSQMPAIKNRQSFSYCLDVSDGSAFSVYSYDEYLGTLVWALHGEHNVKNAMSAMLAARHVGVPIAVGIEALQVFKGVKRRMELLQRIERVFVYDDFAHHPTAIETTLSGLRERLVINKGGDIDNKAGNNLNLQVNKIIALIEPRSNTMKQGVHKSNLFAATQNADYVFWKDDDQNDWSLEEAVFDQQLPERSRVFNRTDVLIEQAIATVKQNLQDDELVNIHIVIMSNGGFDGIQSRIIEKLNSEIN